MRLFQNTRRHRNPTVVEAVALPCLAVLKRLAQSSPEVKQSQEMAVRLFTPYTCTNSFCCEAICHMYMNIMHVHLAATFHYVKINMKLTLAQH